MGANGPDAQTLWQAFLNIHAAPPSRQNTTVRVCCARRRCTAERPLGRLTGVEAEHLTRAGLEWNAGGAMGVLPLYSAEPVRAGQSIKRLGCAVLRRCTPHQSHLFNRADVCGCLQLHQELVTRAYQRGGFQRPQMHWELFIRGSRPDGCSFPQLHIQTSLIAGGSTGCLRGPADALGADHPVRISRQRGGGRGSHASGPVAGSLGLRHRQR